jgi:hypothetical protein
MLCDVQVAPIVKECCTVCHWIVASAVGAVLACPKSLLYAALVAPSTAEGCVVSHWIVAYVKVPLQILGLW